MKNEQFRIIIVMSKSDLKISYRTNQNIYDSSAFATQRMSFLRIRRYCSLRLFVFAAVIVLCRIAAKNKYIFNCFVRIIWTVVAARGKRPRQIFVLRVAIARLRRYGFWIVMEIMKRRTIQYRTISLLSMVRSTSSTLLLLLCLLLVGFYFF